MPRSSKYPEEFRRDAVALVLSSPQRTVVDIARELGVNRETLRLWVQAARRAGETSLAGGPGSGEISAAERDELRRLRARVRELELEKEILRKATAYFAKEMGR